MKSRKNKNKQLNPEKLQSVIYRTLVNNPKKRMNAKQIIMKQKLGNSYASANEALKILEQENKIIHVKDGRYRINKEVLAKANKEKADKNKESQISNSVSQKSRDGDRTSSRRSKNTMQGTVDLTRSGAGYIMVDELDDDIYVPEKYMNGAFHGDVVKVSVNTSGRRRKPEGKVVDVIKRSTKKLIGKISIQKKYAVVHNDNARLPGDISISTKNLMGAVDGDNVLVEITDWGKGQNKEIWGKVIKLLAENSDSDVAMQAILLGQGFEIDFPAEVIEETEPMSEEITEAEVAKRRDFRKVTTVTIDPDTARDFDDALSIQKLDNGNTEIGIHIADVTHYVKPKTALDKEAYHRSTSVYLVDRVCPMLPEKLSNHLCSLVPHVDRYTFSAVFEFDEKFKVVKKWFGKAIIHSDRRFSYEEAQERLESGEGDFAEELKAMNEVALKLRKEKFKNGAIAFESDEIKFKLDENAKPIGLYVKKRKDAHMLVEDFMLLANKQVALYIAKKPGAEVPYVYRIHDEPNQEKLQEFALFAKELGVKMKVDTPDQVSKSFNTLAKKAKENEQLKMLEPLAIRTMAKAVYSTENIGHYGLAFEYYAHFTSPIRRYADVLVHRILEQNLEETTRFNKEKLEAKCKYISLQERKANVAERDSIKYKQVEYLLDRVGEEFDARVSGIIDRGIFIQLVESRAESMISFTELGDYFVIDENRMKAKSSKTGKTYTMGDTLQVKLLKADLESSRIDVDIV